MNKSFEIPLDSEVQMTFNLIFLGWNQGLDPYTRLENPLLQILYDDVMAFNLDKIIEERPMMPLEGKWGTFRLTSKYTETCPNKTTSDGSSECRLTNNGDKNNTNSGGNFTMTVSILGSSGSSIEPFLLALDNIDIQVRTNSTPNGINGTSSDDTEVDVKDKVLTIC